MPSVGIVCVFYYSKHLSATINALGLIRSKVDLSREVLVCNNPAIRPALEMTSGQDPAIELLQHDNSGLEFGAYQAGVDRLTAGSVPDWIILCNDTFSTHSSFSSITRAKFLLELSRTRNHPAVIGRIDSLTRSYLLSGARSNRWAQTNIFALNRQAFETLKGRIYHQEMDSLVNGTADMADFFSRSVDPILRDHLQRWLFRTSPGPQWYAGAPLTAENAAKMARKARSILQEKYLSALMNETGAEFIDMMQVSNGKKVIRKLEDKVFSFRSR